MHLGQRVWKVNQTGPAAVCPLEFYVPSSVDCNDSSLPQSRWDFFVAQKSEPPVSRQQPEIIYVPAIAESGLGLQDMQLSLLAIVRQLASNDRAFPEIVTIPGRLSATSNTNYFLFPRR